MKYSESNKPIVCMQTNSTCYKGTSKMEIKGVLWHSTGANNSTIRRYVQPSDNDPNKQELLDLIGKNAYGNDWNHTSVQAGLNCWVGQLKDGSVATVQTMPWDFKPWGCGNGSKGSCNNGWIQFEICEDNLNNKDYFQKIYKEACEITAYLCKMFNLDPHGTVEFAGQNVPVITCHCESHEYGLGSNHGDVMHWFSKYGKSMVTARDDVADLMDITPVVPEPVEPPKSDELYRVRKSWEDGKSQIGAYSVLSNAKSACNKAGNGYYVFDKNGNKIYPEEQPAKPEVKPLAVGDAVRLISGAKYANGTNIPGWVFDSKLFLREIYKNTDCVISTLKSGAVTGVVHQKDLIAYGAKDPTFVPYLVCITADTLNVRDGASTNYKINTKVHHNDVFTIVDERNGWGKLKSGAGWIYLDYTKKL